MKSKQSGITLIGFLIIIAVVGFFGFMAMKLVPSYSEFMGVKKAMNQIATEGTNGKSLDDIRRDLMFKMGFQYVDDATIKPNDITIDPRRRRRQPAACRLRQADPVHVQHRLPAALRQERAAAGQSWASNPLKLHYRFRDPSLAELALTHRSVGKPNNERLEFLGDALLGAIVAEMLFEAHPKASEGELSRLRAQLVNGQALAVIARELELGDGSSSGRAN